MAAGRSAINPTLKGYRNECDALIYYLLDLQFFLKNRRDGREIRYYFSMKLPAFSVPWENVVPVAVRIESVSDYMRPRKKLTALEAM